MARDSRSNRGVTTVAIIQARMGSSRLPGKVMERFAGKTALDHVIERTRRCPLLDDVIVATTVEPADDAIAAMCADRGWRCTRGSEHDVLDRYQQAAVAAGAAHVMRITSDCPLVDPEVLSALITRYRGAPAVDYASTVWPQPTFPLGIVAEVFSAEALATAWREDPALSSREHVTPYIYRHPERFRLGGIDAGGAYGHHRWTLDTPQDAALLRLIFDSFADNRFGWREVLALVEAHPDWQAINSGVLQKVVPVAQS
jgi:spore coat polysaccharide biosynthesis protein SpsF